MGIVIKFPDERIAGGERGERGGIGATIVILPVVRIERGTDGPSGLEPGASSPGRKRRRRSSR